MTWFLENVQCKMIALFLFPSARNRSSPARRKIQFHASKNPRTPLTLSSKFYVASYGQFLSHFPAKRRIRYQKEGKLSIEKSKKSFRMLKL